jgi:lipopolysaccharide assembly outer membrane protein LptD (OstA)
MNKKILLIIFLIASQFLKLFAKEETYINTKNLTYDQNKNIVIFSEETKININDTNINLNKGYIDYKNDLVVIDGNFYLSQNKNILSGDNLKSNLRLDNFSANKVNFIY